MEWRRYSQPDFDVKLARAARPTLLPASFMARWPRFPRCLPTTSCSSC